MNDPSNSYFKFCLTTNLTYTENVHLYQLIIYKINLNVIISLYNSYFLNILHERTSACYYIFYYLFTRVTFQCQKDLKIAKDASYYNFKLIFMIIICIYDNWLSKIILRCNLFVDTNNTYIFFIFHLIKKMCYFLTFNNKTNNN